MSYSLDVLRNSWQTSFIMRKVIFQNPLLGSSPGIRRRLIQKEKKCRQECVVLVSRRSRMYYETIWNCKYTIFERTNGWNYLSHLKIFSGFLIRSKKTHKIGSNWHWYYLRISNLLAFDLPAYSRHYVPLPHTFRNILSLSLSQDKPRWGARAYVCSQSVYVML